MKTALCLSGGGANAGFHIGALMALREAGYKYDLVSGVSSGALNGALVAQGEQDRLFDIWHRVHEGEILKKSGKIWSLIKTVILGRKSAYDFSPLMEYIEEEVCLDKIQMPFYVGFFALYTREYVSAKHTEFATEHDFQKAVYASAIMPIAGAPVEHIDTIDRRYTQCLDGGIENVVPLADVIKEDPDTIVIISTHSNSKDITYSNNAIEIGERVIFRCMLPEIIKNDIDKDLLINDLVKQAAGQGARLWHPKTGRTLKAYRNILINPSQPLGSPLDFSRGHIDKCIEDGYREAQLTLKSNI